jgi:hypothetical protein
MSTCLEINKYNLINFRRKTRKTSREKQVERKTSGEKNKWREKQVERKTSVDKQVEINKCR